MPEELVVETVIDTYIKLKKMKEANEYEADEINEKMHKLDAWLKNKCEEIGGKSFKTNNGNAFFSTEQYASISDWDALIKFIKVNNAFGLLEPLVKSSAVADYFDKTGSVPDGVDFGTRITVKVFKSPSNILPK